MNFMTNITNYVMYGLAGSVGLLLLIMLFVSLRNPIIAKLGLRNIGRRPLQTFLIVLGLTLSTIIIIVSLATGDTLNRSVRGQAIEAYGEVDEILSPPLLGTLTQLGLNVEEMADEENYDDNGNLIEGSATADDTAAPSLLDGGFNSVLALLQDGLPAISQERYRQLHDRAQEEPLIDAVAPSIIFPTIIRNNSTGQSEPFGFIFAVDGEYESEFGMTTLDGQPTDIASLRTGVGNIFEYSNNLFATVSDSTSDLATRLGFENVQISDVAIGAAAVGAAVTAAINAAQEGTLDLESLDLENLDLENLDLENFDLESLDLEALGIDPNNINTDDLLGDVLSAVNLNTLGTELDNLLGQAGLELRQGEVYLSRVGAERLDARPGDMLEIFIGPIPLPYRVKGIVEEAGPTAALAPVVVMDLPEAQRLLFMEGRVNNVLISNLGDEYTGLQYTSQVSERLRVLALNDEAVTELAALLRQPDVLSTLERSAAQEGMFGEDEEDVPPFIQNIMEEILPFGNFGNDLQSLVTELNDGTGVSDELRRLFSLRELQFFLLDLPLPAAQQSAISDAVTLLTEIELVDPLNKQTVVTAADVGGAVFSSVFSLFGIFSVLAGIILIFMIFVMLAADRRSELGMARAVGMQRRQLVQMFVTEGVVYDLLAAALGVLLGLGIAYLMIGFIGGVFNNVAGTFNAQLSNILRFRFEVVPSSIVIAYCLGVLLTFIVVTWSSWRVSRLNIVAAMRDIPDNSQSRVRPLWQRIVRLLGALILLGGGIYVILWGDALEITRTQIGATLALAGLAYVIDWVLWFTPLRDEPRQRTVYSLLGIGLLLLWVAPWTAWLAGSGTIFEQNPGTVLLSFMLAGPLIILGAILTIMFNADGIVWVVNRLLGGVGTLTPVLKTSIAYPLSARFRTGMAMLLFAMIITTVTIMSIIITVTQTVVSTDDERYAGFDLETNTTLLSFFNPIRDLEAEIARYPDFDMESIGAVGRISVDPVGGSTVQRADGSGETSVGSIELVGLSDGYLQQAGQYYPLAARSEGYASDAAVWQAMQDRDDLVIVRPSLLNRAFGLDIEVDELGGDLPPLTLTLQPPESATGGAPQTLQIIGVMGDAEMLAGGSAQASGRTVEALLGEPSQNVDFYVEVADGYDVHEVAAALESAFVSGGLDVVILAESFAAGQAVTRGVLRLFQGFMALGLLVGIAALGVISSRTVVERRQQIGMLRAIGYQPRMVALSFVLESSFIALAGIGIGTATGVILGRNIIGELYSVVTQGASFPLPWLQIGLILLAAYVFSLLTTIAPAIQASRIYPAEALRYD